METRPFGKTGQSFPILGFGGAPIGNAQRCSEEDAIRVVNHALDGGIRYFDTAWLYSNGLAETRLGKVVKHRRDKMWIATKVWDTSRDGARRQLEESLGRLQTDHVDEWRIHDMSSFSRLDACTDRGGALEAAIQAKEEGLVGHISISGHTDPQILLEAFRRFPFESALVALSVLDHFMLSFAEEFLPFANSQGIPVIAMNEGALDALIEWAVEIQDCLGELQDTVFTRKFINGLLEDWKGKLVDPDLLFILGEIYKLQSEIARGRRETFGRIWKRFSSEVTIPLLKDILLWLPKRIESNVNLTP